MAITADSCRSRRRTENQKHQKQPSLKSRKQPNRQRKKTAVAKEPKAAKTDEAKPKASKKTKACDDGDDGGNAVRKRAKCGSIASLTWKISEIMPDFKENDTLKKCRSRAFKTADKRAKDDGHSIEVIVAARRAASKAATTAWNEWQSK